MATWRESCRVASLPVSWSHGGTRRRRRRQRPTDAPLIPSRSRSWDPLIKSEAPERCNDRDENECMGIYDRATDRERRLEAGESRHTGTNVEPDPRVPLQRSGRLDARAEPARRPDRRQITYGKIRAWRYARHGFSPRTGWIAHVKELSGLRLRPTHNRRDPRRVDPCPPERRAAIEEALRHFGIL